MSNQQPKNDNVETPQTSDSGKSASGVFSGLEDVAKSAWNSVSNMTDTVVNATAHALQVAGEGLPKVSLIADDTDKDKELWNSFGNDAKASGRSTHEYNALKQQATLGDALATELKEVRSGSARASDKTGAVAGESSKFTDRAFDWLKSGWDSLFGSPYKPAEGGRSVQKTDVDGNVSETKWGRGVVEHTDKGGTTTVDAKMAKHVDASGATAIMDKTTKELSETGAQGSKAILDRDGRYHVEDGLGNKVEWQNGHLMAVSKDGTATEITDKEVIQRFKQSEWRIRQSRHRGDRGDGSRHNRPSIEAVADDKDDTQQMVMINDGKGTVVNVHQDGRKEIIVGEGENQTTFMMKPGSKEILAIRGDDKAVLRRENGEWNVYDMDGNRLDANSRGLGGSLAGRGGEIRVSGSTTIKTDGTVDTANDSGQHVQVAAGGTSAVIKDAHGAGKDVRIAAHGGTSTVQTNEESAIGTTSVDTTSSAVRQQTTGEDGQPKTIFNLDPTKTDYLTINTLDGLIRANKDAEGHEQIHLWNNDIFDTDKRILHLHDGTEFDALNDKIKFPDGMWLDRDGYLYDEEEMIGEYEEEYYEELEENQAETQALVDMAQSLAASIAGKAGDATLSDVGALMALYSQLGGMKAQAMALADMSSFAKLDSAIAVTDAAIQKAQIQLAQQNILSTMTTLSPDLMAQAHNMMPHAVSHDGIRQLLQAKGVVPAGQPSYSAMS